MLTSNLISGPRVLWIRGYLRLVDVIRKTTLIWRTINRKERIKFIKIGKEVFLGNE